MKKRKLPNVSMNKFTSFEAEHAHLIAIRYFESFKYCVPQIWGPMSSELLEGFERCLEKLAAGRVTCGWEKDLAHKELVPWRTGAGGFLFFPNLFDLHPVVERTMSRKDDDPKSLKPEIPKRINWRNWKPMLGPGFPLAAWWTKADVTPSVRNHLDMQNSIPTRPSMLCLFHSHSMFCKRS